MHGTALLGTLHTLFLLLIVIQCVSLLISPRPSNQPIHIRLRTHLSDSQIAFYVGASLRTNLPASAASTTAHAYFSGDFCVPVFLNSLSNETTPDILTVCLQRPQRPSPLAVHEDTGVSLAALRQSQFYFWSTQSSLLKFGGWERFDQSPTATVSATE